MENLFKIFYISVSYKKENIVIIYEVLFANYTKYITLYVSHILTIYLLILFFIENEIIIIKYLLNKMATPISDDQWGCQHQRHPRAG